MSRPGRQINSRRSGPGARGRGRCPRLVRDVRSCLIRLGTGDNHLACGIGAASIQPHEVLAGQLSARDLAQQLPTGATTGPLLDGPTASSSASPPNRSTNNGDREDPRDRFSDGSDANPSLTLDDDLVECSPNRCLPLGFDQGFDNRDLADLWHLLR